MKIPGLKQLDDWMGRWMPLFEDPTECGKDDCHEMTFYYKELFISYPEYISVSTNRQAKHRKARLHLCPIHYEAPLGRYEITTGQVILDDLS